MLDDFHTTRIATSGSEIFVRWLGRGPAVLLLHGFPETHVMWHKIAPRLAERFRVVLADLRGYGDSAKPQGTADHATYSKRAMAKDMAEVMSALGEERFALVGHDRGARVAHRLALDFPERVGRLAVLDIAPTHTMFRKTDKDFATAYYHWFFLIQPYDFPERTIARDPADFLEQSLRSWSRVEGAFAPEALAEYRRAFQDPAAIHAACEDYRAAATIDFAQDEADLDRRLDCPLLALWGEEGVIHRTFDVLATWREKARDVTGRPVPGGHFLPEEAPDETLEALLAFL